MLDDKPTRPSGTSSIKTNHAIWLDGFRRLTSKDLSSLTVVIFYDHEVNFFADREATELTSVDKNIRAIFCPWTLNELKHVQSRN